MGKSQSREEPYMLKLKEGQSLQCEQENNNTENNNNNNNNNNNINNNNNSPGLGLTNETDYNCIHDPLKLALDIFKCMEEKLNKQINNVDDSVSNNINNKSSNSNSNSDNNKNNDNNDNNNNNNNNNNNDNNNNIFLGEVVTHADQGRRPTMEDKHVIITDVNDFFSLDRFVFLYVCYVKYECFVCLFVMLCFVCFYACYIMAPARYIRCSIKRKCQHKV